MAEILVPLRYAPHTIDDLQPWRFPTNSMFPEQTPELQRRWLGHRLALRRYQRLCDRLGRPLRIGDRVRNTDPDCHTGAVGKVIEFYLSREIDVRLDDNFPESGVGVRVEFWMNLPGGPHFTDCFFDGKFIEMETAS
jgi:hypothetical protein